MSILILILISCFLLAAFLLMLPAKPHNHVVLENTLPKDKLQDIQVKQLAKNYRIRLIQIAVVSSLLSLSLIYIPYDSVYFLIFFLLLFGNIAASFFL